MSRTSPTFVSLVGLAIGGTLACAPDIGELEELPPPDSVVTAQFDPTNPIPQLQVTPSPTALAQNPDGSINRDAVRPAPCELPTPAQCLEFAPGGWPATLLPTLNFSGPLVMDTLGEGIRLYRVGTGGLERVSATFVQAPRPPPPEACQSGDNGTNPPRTFSQTDVVEAWGLTPTDVTIVPDVPLEPGAQYIVVATQSLEGSPLTENGAARPIEPSALFFLLNDDEPPADLDANDPAELIPNPLLRSNVQASVLDALFPSQAAEDLDPGEREQFFAALRSSAESLQLLYMVLNGAIEALVAAGELANRDEAVMVNTWTVGGPSQLRSQVVFEPAASTFPTDVRFPLPSDPLLTATTADGLRVAFPTEGLSPTLAGVVNGLNTLSGFGLTTPILVQTTRTVDEATLADNVFMIELDPMGMPTENRPPIDVVATASTAESPNQIVITPLVPLKPNTRYAVGITTGVQDLAGQPFESATQFEFVKESEPLIENGVVNAAVRPALECATTSTVTGALGSEEEVQTLAAQLEAGLARPRWQTAFEALETLSPAIPRSDVTMAFTYTTQSVTDTIDLVNTQLLPNNYETLPPIEPRVLDLGLELTGTSTLANLVQLVENFCVPICAAGGLEPDVPRDQCEAPAQRPAIANSAPCQLLETSFFSGLGSARLGSLRTYRVTSGNPFVSGSFTPETLAVPTVERIPFWVVTPPPPAPPEGWPVAIFQHGLGSQKESALLTANTLAAAGWATVAIDLPFHGQRASDILDNTTGLPCLDVDPGNVVCDPVTMTCTEGCDGVQDASGSGFLTPNIFSIRDNFRQSTIDQLALIRALSQDAGGGFLADLNGDRVAYIGQSLGGIAGGNLAAVASTMDLEAAVLNAAGGNLFFILDNTVPEIAAGLYVGLANAGVCELEDPTNPAAGCRPTPLFQVFGLLAQWVTEPGDPNGTAAAVTDPARNLMTIGPERILMQISQPDPVIVNDSSLLLASSYGFDLAQGDERFQIYDFSALPEAEQGNGCHSFYLTPQCGACLQDAICRTLGAQGQATEFIDSQGMMVGEQLPMTLLPGTPFEIDCANPCMN